MPNPNMANSGAFLPTTNEWNAGDISGLKDVNDDLKNLLVSLYQNIADITTMLNIKDSAYYNNQEFVNGQLFFPNPALTSNTSTTAAFRQVFRMVVDFGALPNTATKSVAHNIPVNSGYTFTRIYGTATDPDTKFIPLPYSSATLNNNIEIWVDPTNVNVKTAINYSAYTTTYFVVEYLKF